MTEDRYRLIAQALSACRFLPGSWDKRFARDMGWHAEHMERDYTEKQKEQLLRMAHCYRSQLPDSVVEMARKPEHTFLGGVLALDKAGFFTGVA